VDYVEQAGSELTLEAMKETGDAAGGKVNGIFSRIRTELVEKLKHKDINLDVLTKMEERLTERMEDSIRHLKSSMVFNQMRSQDARPPTKADMLALLKTHAKDDDELTAIVLQVKETLAERGVHESMFQEIYDDIMAKPAPKQKEKSKLTPPGSLNRGSTLFVLEKEILRANRYNTPFSILSFTVVKAVPKEAAKPGSVTPEDIIAAFVVALTGIVRETDLVGMLGAKMIVVIQPMTTGDNAKIALERISKLLKSHEMAINEIPFDINFTATVTPFDAEETIDLKTFVKRAQANLKNLADRISNIQSMV
jgi:GGDEF domain-containing protein